MLSSGLCSLKGTTNWSSMSPSTWKLGSTMKSMNPAEHQWSVKPQPVIFGINYWNPMNAMFHQFKTQRFKVNCYIQNLSSSVHGLQWRCEVHEFRVLMKRNLFVKWPPQWSCGRRVERWAGPNQPLCLPAMTTRSFVCFTTRSIATTT